MISSATAAAPWTPRVLAPDDVLPWTLPAWLSAWRLPLLLAVIALLIRLPGLAAKDLWFDEVQTWTDVSYPPPPGQPHRLFFLMVAFFAAPFSDPTVAARIWPLVAGVLTVPLMFLAGRRVGGAALGVLAATIVAFSPFHVEFSQEARFYAPMILFAAVGVWGGLFFLQESRWMRWLGLLASVVAGWAAMGHQPTAIPWVAAHHAMLGVILAFSPIGRDAVGMLMPPVRRGSWYYAAAGAGAVLAAVGGWIVVPPYIRESIKAVFTTPWGGSENVDLTLEFFTRHATVFAIDYTSIPLVGMTAGIASLLALAVGTVVLTRRRALVGALLFVPIVGQMLAIFAISRPGVAYLVKYSCCVMPAILLLVSVAILRLGKCLTPRLDAGRVLVAVAALMAVVQSPGLVTYHLTQKMPLRPLLRWVAENEKQPASVFLYGHMGYQGALYANALPEPHRIEYFPWYRQADAGSLEVQRLKASAAIHPTYMARAWDADVPAALDEYLRRNANVVYTMSSSSGKSQDGRLYRIRPSAAVSIMDGINATDLLDFDRFRRPTVVGNELEMRDASSIVYTADLVKGRVYTLDLGIRSTEGRSWVLAVDSPALDHPLLRTVSSVDDKPTTVSLGFTAARDASHFSISQVSDYPEARDPNQSLRLTRLRLREGGERSPGLMTTEANGPIPWDDPTFAVGRWIQPTPFAEALNPTSDETRNFRLTNWEGNLISSPKPIRPGELVYTRVQLTPIGLYGVGGNAGLIFLDANGRPIQQGLSSNRSHSSVIRWAPVEYPLHFRNHPQTFECVRQAPPGAAFVAVYLPFWETEKRHYLDAPNQIQLDRVWLTRLIPVTRAGEGSR